MATTIPLPVGVFIVGSTQRYPVEGRTVAEIGRSMRERAPQGGTVLGYHSYRLQWTWRMESPRGFCRFSDVRVDIQTLIRIPEWQRPPDAPAELVAQWESFITALDEHERGHERIAVEGAGDMVRRLRAMQAMTCSRLGLDANREAQLLGTAMQEREVQFDLDTQHGGREGARWPPRPPADSAR